MKDGRATATLCLTSRSYRSIEAEVTVPEGWLDVVARGLGIDVSPDPGPLLDAARDVAHNVERKATPLTTFLIGVAVGQRGASVELTTLCARVSELARAWDADADGRTS